MFYDYFLPVFDLPIHFHNGVSLLYFFNILLWKISKIQKIERLRVNTCVLTTQNLSLVFYYTFPVICLSIYLSICISRFQGSNCRYQFIFPKYFKIILLVRIQYLFAAFFFWFKLFIPWNTQILSEDWLNFDKCIYLWDFKLYEDVEYYHHSAKFSHAPSPLPFPRGNHCPVFLLHHITLASSETSY